jgi:predicted enzyme related to lactoylglutathione lyase
MLTKMNKHKILGIDNVFMPAQDLRQSRIFYGETLELPLKFDFSERGLLAFHLGNGEPAIILKDKEKFPDARPSLLLQVTDVQQLYRKLADRGVVFTRQPYRIHTGWAAELQDPSGNIIGITDYNMNEE